MSYRSLLTAMAGLAAGAALTVLPAAPAKAADPVLAVQITGIHVVDWTYRIGDFDDDCAAWTKGDGTTTMGFSNPKPIRYELADIGIGKLLVPGRTSRFKGSAARQADWKEHLRPMTSACTPCGPLSEYGECEEDEQDLLAPLWSCKRQTPGNAQSMLQLLPAGTELEGGVVSLADVLVVISSMSAEWKHCPPDFEGSPSGVATHSTNPLEVRIVGPQVKKLMRLRRGGTVTLKGSAERLWDGAKEREGCSSPGTGVGYRECAVTDVTVEVRRIR